MTSSTARLIFSSSRKSSCLRAPGLGWGRFIVRPVRRAGIPLIQMFPILQERWIVRAHNHIGQVRLWDERTIITAGAVGLPLDGSPTAQYPLLEQRAGGWRIFHQAIAYDL